jgi:hypothetical protein
MTRKKIIPILLFFAVLVASLFMLQKLVVPKYMSGIVEGALIESYYEEHKDHDVIFIGDCEVYENFSPITLWEEYGITSFIRGSAQQLIWQSYYLLEETLKYEKPEVVVFNVLSMKYDTPQKETYNRMTIDGMKLSSAKINSIKASMLEEENMLSYLVPFLRFHSRWDELTKEDFAYLMNKKKLFHSGYYMRADVKPVETIPVGKPLPDYTFGENSYKYLDMMDKLCKDNGIELVLIKAPTIYPVWYDQWDEQMVQYAKEKGLQYYNLLELSDEAGIDFQTDTYDAGLHLNVYGAEKLSIYFGNILKTEFGLTDRHGDETLDGIWQNKTEFYYSMKNQQISDLKKYGKLMTYGQLD